MGSCMRQNRRRWIEQSKAIYAVGSSSSSSSSNQQESGEKRVVEMAETGGVGGTRATLSRCDDKCGCEIPCPGGQSCRCTLSAGGEAGEQHSYCSCGKHCSCNPCRCAKTEEATPTGKAKAFCKCGDGCTCVIYTA